MQEAVEEELSNMEREGILEKVSTSKTATSSVYSEKRQHCLIVCILQDHHKPMYGS